MGQTLHVLSAYLAYHTGPSEPRLEGQISQTYSPVIEVQSDIHPTLGRIIIDANGVETSKLHANCWTLYVTRGQ
jgi:hypothetical protein